MDFFLVNLYVYAAQKIFAKKTTFHELECCDILSPVFLVSLWEQWPETMSDNEWREEPYSGTLLVALTRVKIDMYILLFVYLYGLV